MYQGLCWGGASKEADCFTCPAGKLLPFKHFDSDQEGRLSKRYIASTSDYQRCPRKPTCAPRASAAKSRARPTMSTTAEHSPGSRAGRGDRCVGCDSARLNRQSAACSSTMACAGSTREGAVAPITTTLLTAIAFNLNKLLNYQSQKTMPLASALPRPTLKGLFLACRKRRRPHHLQFEDGQRKTD